MNNITNTIQYETLKHNIYRAAFSNRPTAVTRREIDKMAKQMRYLEKFIQPEVKEAAK